MVRRLKSSQNGVTLIEIMVAIIIFTTVMMTFAMAFPGGYRLNMKTRNQSRAAQIASGIISKIQNMEFSRADAFGSYSTVPTIENLASYDPYSIRQFDTFFNINDKAHFLDAAGKETKFYFPNSTNDGVKGIIISNPDPTWAQITVNIAWREPGKNGTIKTNIVTVSAFRSGNHE